MFEKYGFKLIEREDYKGHSVIFYFRRHSDNKLLDLNFKNDVRPIHLFFKNILSKVNSWNEIIESNKEKRIFIWPASIHVLYLLQFGLSKKVYGFLDNSSNKINKLIYGYNIPIYNFKDILELNSDNDIILINGGLFNNDIIDQCKEAKNIKFIF